jgi:hypothetical protein
MKTKIFGFIFLVLALACNNKPKVIEAQVDTDQPETTAVDESANRLHKVIVNEALNTSRYTYLNVTEDGESFWIAIPKKEIEIGGTYYYRGGLKKTNFKSVEHDRIFETLYLVSDVSKDPGMTTVGSGNPHQHLEESSSVEPAGKINPPPGGITLAELFANKEKYNGKKVRVKGQCVKLNNMIMNRNWIHISDGSVKEEGVDLTVTTTEQVNLGDIVSFEGVISLNKDFGAGYKYEIIMEEATLLP